MAKKSGRQNRQRPAARRPQARQRPLPAGESFVTPSASSLRQRLESRSATVLVFMHRLPRWVPFVLMLGLLAAALLVKGVLGAVFLVLLAVLLSWLAFLSWPNLGAGDRAFRVLAILVVLLGAALVATGA